MSEIMERRRFLEYAGTAGALALVSASGLTACASGTQTDKKVEPMQSTSNPIWEPHAKRDRIVVVSDLHLGIDDRFAQDVDNRRLFVEFIGRLVEVGDVRELVIAGDFLDEWIVPLSYPAYDDSDAFYRQCVATNQVVFDALGEAVAAGIQVVYVPGNHDMLLSENVLSQALPNLVQARSSRGMGLYVTGDRNEVAVEHCHRYDVYSAPDAVSNRDLAGNDDTLLPPGYFYARLGTQWVAEGCPHNAVDYPKDVVAPDSSDVDQYGAYLHYKILTSILLSEYTPNVSFDERIFKLHTGGLDGTYSEYDLCPRQMEDGTICAPILYRNFQRTWDQRQRDNGVKVPLSFVDSVSGYLDAATGVSRAPYYREQAQMQYLDDAESGIDVVVFGHTHIPDFHDFGAGRFYANSGTWIDQNLDADETRTFVVITTGDVDEVSLYMYGEDGKISDITAASVDA